MSFLASRYLHFASSAPQCIPPSRENYSCQNLVDERAEEPHWATAKSNEVTFEYLRKGFTRSAPSRTSDPWGAGLKASQLFWGVQNGEVSFPATSQTFRRMAHSNTTTET